VLAEDSDEANDRLENLSQLVSAAYNFVEEASALEQPSDICAFLEAAALLSSSEDETFSNNYDGLISLMTMHAAKGLEFDVVFIVAMEEHGFPHVRASVEGAPPEELEEERRLAYVGMTRAKKKLILTYAQRRMVHGSVRNRLPSRFLCELPDEVIDGIKPKWWQERLGSISNDWSFDKPKSHSLGIETRVEYTPEFMAEQNRSGLSRGAKVWHKLYGSEQVISLSPSGNKVKTRVRFDQDASERVIYAEYLQKA